MAATGSSAAPAPAGESSSQRWAEMLNSLATLLPDRAASVLVDGPPDRVALFAARLEATLDEKFRARKPRIRVTADSGGAPDVTIFLRSAPGGRHTPVYRKAGEEQRENPECAADRADCSRREHEERADIVVDLHDVYWPVIRRVAEPLAGRGSWYLSETRAFFAPRAATWDARFGDDLPAYRAAVAEAGIRREGVVIDVGCGTGRALPSLRAAVGPDGAVIALDVTPEMLAAARPAASAANAALVVADARELPFADRSADAMFAAGLVNHLPDTVAGLRELARVTRTDGLLVIFHPSGRAALAARHGHALSPDEPLAESPLRRFTAAAGWRLTAYDDAPHRFFALAERR